MRASSLWALLPILGARLALGRAIETSPTSTVPATTSSAAPSCTASLITTLCDYPEPLEGTAVAASGTDTCWQYCNSHTPCSFVIFVRGNPYTGTGTCWLYPGESFDASKGSSDCGDPYLSVYGKPECAGGSSATTSAGACAATASPSAIASVCGYPTPPDDCQDDCYASGGASDCLSICAKSDSCSYAVFNAGNTGSQYQPGSCWIYAEGKYEPKSAGTCSAAPDQFVYKNLCPKPPLSSTSTSATTTAPSGADAAAATEVSTTSSDSLAPTGISFSQPLAIGVVAIVWQGLS